MRREPGEVILGTENYTEGKEVKRGAGLTDLGPEEVVDDVGGIQSEQ